MNDDEIDARVDSIMALSEEDQVMAIRAIVESLPLERREVLRELMRGMLESD